MVALVPKLQKTDPVGERRVTFYYLDWQKYQAILAAVGESRSTKLTYDSGTLEITMPLEVHEQASELLGLFIRILVEELGLRLKSMGSTTLDYPQLDKGAEPDKAYYIQNYAQVAGRKVDLTQDPPPDLVVEVDITRTDIDKLRLYASMGVPELWRYDGEEIRFYQRHSVQRSAETASSSTFPGIPKTRLYEFLAQASLDEVTASQNLRQWVNALKPPD